VRRGSWIASSRRLLIATLLAAASGCAHAAVPASAGGATLVVVVRHTERSSDDPADPSLSASGRDRADELRRVLGGSDVAAIYVTQYRRTRDAGAPLAAALGIEPTVRPIDASNAATYSSDLAREILRLHAGRSVVVIGHSNTVPEMVEALGGGKIEPIPESEYDRMYVIVIDQGDRVRLVAPSCGAPTV
jgi:broad specificity phosphatase PhoE